MNKLNVSIIRLSENVPMPEYKTPGAVAFDLAVSEGGVIKPGETKIFPTGLVVCVPEDHALVLASRSSNAKKGINLSNGVGIIDQDYCGPDDQLHLALHNIGLEPYTVEPGERLAQGLFLPVSKATFEEGNTIKEKNRGGFGTTG